MLALDTIRKAQFQCIHFEPAIKDVDIRLIFEPSGFEIIVCDLTGISSAEPLFIELSRALSFPEYFGKNWDALDECLTDMEWLPAEGYILVAKEASAFWRTSPSIAGKLVESWLFAAGEWSKENIPFHLIFLMEER